MRAIWHGQVLADSNQTIVIEGNHYFPPFSINRDFFIESETTSVCPWKGTANYYTVRVGSEENSDAAWYYPSPKEAAAEIKGYIAFWRGVEVTD
ncbi:MAG: DUF427 domain-containing protein [Candidatus Thiodiazotropha sp. (ex Semelilucina semeliformis)]|nr:DUF427 domain-containing protein [Candidatus Thiodiazotropha sp. (ex Myrtea spinifera)]MCU7806454.1 DUF427 domain-containing protein [Candidatus Thiodiazotropha sp. (ex Semelilucina semeliformis)]MCU7829944.1 DUF427 domain-containing protein [Candidatus Thiodiazotropha sp. (ex Myrtea sp. 'scaly one' KF741663)]